eukprot:TRINITY_DN4863_c0_g1_i2.p1 TRINITY_DN4863_c0_g1~~TRINITY_DN4863_c0_g1_i2.p1  ORF type:complete len:598 (-),score=93.58 TRINITY_DN4863_c0_g1_i2:156-1829(-)
MSCVAMRSCRAISDDAWREERDRLAGIVPVGLDIIGFYLFGSDPSLSLNTFVSHQHVRSALTQPLHIYDHSADASIIQQKSSICGVIIYTDEPPASLPFSLFSYSPSPPHVASGLQLVSPEICNATQLLHSNYNLVHFPFNTILDIISSPDRISTDLQQWIDNLSGKLLNPSNIFKCSSSISTHLPDLSISRLDVLVKLTNNSSQPSPAPSLSYSDVDAKATHITMPLRGHVCGYVPPSLSPSQVGATLAPALLNQMRYMARGAMLAPKTQPTIYHFQPPGYGHVISTCYMIEPGSIAEDYLGKQRAELHDLLLFPHDRPLLRTTNAILFTGPAPKSQASSSSSSSNHLLDVHLPLPTSSKVDGRQALVQGSYEYYHYMQDDIDDRGWGCAYRSLQTICSWLRLQHYTNRPEPSHLEIQQLLVRIGDKPPSFVGSSQWIGAFELSLCLDTLYSITCRILNLSSGAELASRGRELAAHFASEGSPVMIGGGVLAYTLLGVDWNESTGAVRFLILDPHYIGPDQGKGIRDKGWCAWKGPDIFRKDSFYNLCMPLRPKMI